MQLPEGIEMAEQITEHNPFMLLVHPEVVLAAVEKSERLERLNRHLCRPLDRPTPTSLRDSALVDGEDDHESRIGDA
jgi:hypothetical protein